VNSYFEDLDTRNLFVKSKFNLDTRFRIYNFFSNFGIDLFVTRSSVDFCPLRAGRRDAYSHPARRASTTPAANRFACKAFAPRQNNLAATQLTIHA
jgi:hypothetical protein